MNLLWRMSHISNAFDRRREHRLVGYTGEGDQAWGVLENPRSGRILPRSTNVVKSILSSLVFHLR